MTTKTTKRPLQPGETVHVLSGGLTIFGHVFKRGGELTASARDIDDQRDLNGNSWCDDLSEAGQLLSWGEQRLGFGPWPEGEPRWTHGDPEWAEERESARRRAWRIDDPVKRAAARERVEAEFGPAPSTSRTINKAPTAQQQSSGNVRR